MEHTSSTVEQPQIEGLITKRGAWPDERGRIFLEVDGRVIILADECTAAAGDRVTYKGLARAALADGTQYYRARKTRSTLTVVESNGVPCQLRGVVAGVSQTRKCFWLQGAHVLAGRFALPAVGQIVELRGCEETVAGNYFAGATASMRADGQELLPVNMDKMRGGASEADYRALETVARRELGGDVGSVLAGRVVSKRGLKRSAHDELLAAFFFSRKDDDAEPLKASLLEDLRPGRVDAVVFGTVERRDGGAVLRGRRASVLLKAHSEAYELPLNASVAIDGCGLRKRPRDQSHQILVAARHRILVEGTGESITVEPCEDEAAALLFGEVLDVRRVTEQHVLLLVDDVDRGPVLVRAPSDDFVEGAWAAPAFCDAYPWVSGGGDGGADPRALLGCFVACEDVIFIEEEDDVVQTVRVVGAALVAVDRKRPPRCRAARVSLGDALRYASSRLRTPPAPCSTYRVCVEAALNLEEGEEVCVCGRVFCIKDEKGVKALPLQGQHGAEMLRGQLAQVRRCPLCASIDLGRLSEISEDAQQKGSLRVVERSFVLDDGTASMRCEWRCCGCAARDWPGESARMDGQLAVVRGSVSSDYRGFTFIHVASLRLADEEELPLWTLLTPRVADGWDG
jgi:hypothetical protein